MAWGIGNIILAIILMQKLYKLESDGESDGELELRHRYLKKCL
jgi:hypothetical protein